MKITQIGYNTGITPISLEDGKLIVGFDFGHFNQEAPVAVEFRESVYLRGPLEIIPMRESADYCSVRSYKEKVNPYDTPEV